MNKETERSGKVLEMLLPAASCFALCAILVLSFTAVKGLSTGYRKLVDADLTKDLSESLHYDDHMYAVLGKGIVLDDTAALADRPMIMTSFLKEALSYIDQRIFAAGVFYAMMISVIALYPLTKRRPQHVWLIGPLIYVLYIAFETLTHVILSVPFYFPKGTDIVRVLCELIAVSGGICALSLLIERMRYQRLISLMTIPAVFLLFLAGMYLEFGICSPKNVDSFDYVYSMDSRVVEEGYYDSKRNVLVFDGKEYPPEQAENPEHYTGIGLLGASAFEILYPCSGAGLYMVEQAMEHEVSLLMYVLYALKGLIWIFCQKRSQDKKVPSAEGNA